MHQVVKQETTGLVSFLDDLSLDMRGVEGEMYFTGFASFWVLADPHIKAKLENIKSEKSGCS